MMSCRDIVKIPYIRKAIILSYMYTFTKFTVGVLSTKYT